MEAFCYDNYMKLIQLNTWSCKLPTEITKLFQNEKPDIACLQEIVTAVDGGKIIDTIDTILNDYPFEYTFNTPLVEFNFMHRQATRGNMIASNLTIFNNNELWTHGSFFKNFDYINSGGYNVARNIAHAEISTPEGNVHVLTLHGYHIKEHKNGDEQTMHACRELVAYASALHGPVIITGDFNLSPESESLKLVNKAFRNLSIENELSTTRNHLTSKKEVCDYIFVNDKIRVENFFMSDAVASDHNALVLEFSIQ